jgi:hypothetical protein
MPTEALLQQVQEGRVLCPDGVVHPHRVIEAFQANPDSTLLTFTNDAANKLNTYNIKPVRKCTTTSFVSVGQ